MSAIRTICQLLINLKLILAPTCKSLLELQRRKTKMAVSICSICILFTLREIGMTSFFFQYIWTEYYLNLK